MAEIKKRVVYGSLCITNFEDSNTPTYSGPENKRKQTILDTAILFYV